MSWRPVDMYRVQRLFVKQAEVPEYLLGAPGGWA
jgi:hypothetical protein